MWSCCHDELCCRVMVCVCTVMVKRNATQASGSLFVCLTQVTVCLSLSLSLSVNPIPPLLLSPSLSLSLSFCLPASLSFGSLFINVLREKIHQTVSCVYFFFFISTAQQHIFCVADPGEVETTESGVSIAYLNAPVCH